MTVHRSFFQTLSKEEMNYIASEVSPKQYYYSITGDVVAGDNKTDKVFTSIKDQRFALDRPPQILTQSLGWGPESAGTMQPYISPSGLPSYPATMEEDKKIPAPHNAA